MNTECKGTKNPAHSVMNGKISVVKYCKGL